MSRLAPLAGRPALCALVLALVATGCAAGQGDPIADALAAAGGRPGWTLVGEAQTFDSQSIYNLVNGQADSYFAYGFEQVGAASYQNEEGTIVRIEVWELSFT